MGQITLENINLSNNHEDTKITIFLTGELTMQLSSDISRDLLEIESNNRDNNIFNPIQLIINSPGGDLYSSWMLCDIMNLMKTPIHTIGFGQVASAGIMIFMNGTKGTRAATINTQFMSHRYTLALEASHQNIMSQDKEFKRIHTRIVDHYKKCTGLPQKTIASKLLTEHDVWLTALDCKKYNICDIILDVDNFDKIKHRRQKNG